MDNLPDDVMDFFGFLCVDAKILIEHGLNILIEYNSNNEAKNLRTARKWNSVPISYMRNKNKLANNN